MCTVVWSPPRGGRNTLVSHCDCLTLPSFMSGDTLISGGPTLTTRDLALSAESLMKHGGTDSTTQAEPDHATDARKALGPALYRGWLNEVDKVLARRRTRVTARRGSPDRAAATLQVVAMRDSTVVRRQTANYLLRDA